MPENNIPNTEQQNVAPVQINTQVPQTEGQTQPIQQPATAQTTQPASTQVSSNTQQAEPQAVPQIAIQVVVRNPADQNIYMIKSKKWEGQFEVLRGALKSGESLQEGAVRIVRERLGIETKNPVMVSIQESIFAKEFAQPHHFIFFGYVVNLVGQINSNDVDGVWKLPYDVQTLTVTDTTREFLNTYVKKAREMSV